MRTSLLTLLLAAAPLSALAEDPCAADAVRLCSKAKGETALLGCLRGQDKEVTPACKENLSLLLAIAQEYGKDCEADARKLCADTPPGEGRLLRCLKDNESFLSQSCQSAFNRVRLERSKIQASCAGDVGRFCHDVPEGSGRVLACLRKHEQELTSDCRDVLGKLP
jgi:cysteine rich repeat protein